MPLLFKTLSTALGQELLRTYRGGAGDDILYGDSNLNATLLGIPSNDTLLGGAGDDQLYGNAGNDRLFGDEGDDFLDGGLGQDWLRGGLGADILQGEDGADVHAYGTAQDSLLGTHDVVAGFDFTQDRFHFDGPPVLSTSTRLFHSVNAVDLDVLLGFVMRGGETDEAALVQLTGAVQGT